MKNKLLKNLSLIFTLISTFSHAINIKYIKDTYEVLKPEYRHLSPVHGAVWWEKGLVQKYYKFGFYGKSIPKTKKGIAHAPYGTVALIRDLFHEVQGSFNVTKSPSSTAFHFSAETVAKILATIETYKDKPITQREKVLVEKKGKKIEVNKTTGLADELKQVITSDTDFQASIKKYQPQYDELRKKMEAYKTKESEIKKKFAALIVERKKLQQKSKETLTEEEVLALKEIEDQMAVLTDQLAPIEQIKKEFGQYNIQDAQGRKKLNPLVNAIVASLQECGFVQSHEQPSYPKKTTHSVLLAFLYRKAEEKSEFKKYFDEVQNVLKKPILTKDGAQQVANQQWISSAFDDSNAGIKKILDEIKHAVEAFGELKSNGKVTLEDILHKISFAKIVFGEVSRPQALPHVAEYTDVFFEKVKFPDCAETTMRNLCNIATYNAKDNRFDINEFKNSDPAIKKFYTIYSNAAELELYKIHQAWVPIIENKPFVAYHRIVAPNNPQKVAIAPYGTQGFIYGFKNIEKLKPQAIEVSFKDGSSDALQKVTINDGEYILIDEKQYHAFEVRPSLRNTIILMNQFFGLDLYKDLNIEFFKKDFNKTYFPQLTKQFGWEYDEYKYPNIDTGDYGAGLSIELTTKSGGQFLLSLASYAHGFIEIISAQKIEEYQKKLSKFVVDILARQKLQVTADLLCFYVSPYAAGLAQSSLLLSTQHLFMRYIYYLQNLNNPNTAVQISKELMQQKDSVLLNLAAALIANLPIREDLYYQIQVTKAIQETKGQALQNPAIRNIIDEIIKKVMYSDVTHNASQDFFQGLIPNYSKLVDFAEQGSMSSNKNYQKNGILLFADLVKKGFALDIANKTLQHLLEKKAIPAVTYILLNALVERGKAIDSQIKIIEKKVIDETPSSKVYKIVTLGSLLRNKKIMQNTQISQKIIRIATQYALQIMKDEATHVNDMIAKKEALNIMQDLVEKGYSYKGATEAAKIGILLEDYPVPTSGARHAAIALFRRLFTKRKGFNEALEVANKAIQNEDEYIQNIGLELFIELVKNNHAINEAIKAAQQGLKADMPVKSSAKILKELLQEKGKWPKEQD